MPLGDRDLVGPKTTDLQWLGLRLRDMFEDADVEVFSANWALNGHIRIRITHDGSFKDLTVPLGMLANQDWERLLAHWREEQKQKPWQIAPKKIYEPGVVRRIQPFRKGHPVH